MTIDLSIIIPCYNEAPTLRSIISDVTNVQWPEGMTWEIVLIDDASTDGSQQIARELATENQCLRLIEQSVNQGKGVAIVRGFAEAQGKHVVIQDADKEYDPQDIAGMYRALVDEHADIVIGSRFVPGAQAQFLYGINRLSNIFLTWLSNIFTRQSVSDMETCYKLLPRAIATSLTLKEKRFGIEPEMIAKLSRLGSHLKWIDYPIYYKGRSYQDGKKIRVKDGIRAIYCILYYNLIDRS